jgi:flagellar basal-body rod modification protein FlgD
MAIDPLNGWAYETQSSTKSRNELGQNEFMKLMLAQLKNQDPFKPMDPSEFLGQLAQFSTVTGIQNMESSLGTLSSSLRSAQVLGGVSLVGREVLAPATEMTLESGQTVRGAIDVPGGTSSLTVEVRDSSGQLVRRFAANTSPGRNEFTWDGLTDAGVAVPAGNYRFEVLARVGDENLSLDPMLFSRVASVTIDPRDSSLVLNTNTGALSLKDVRRVQ